MSFIPPDGTARVQHTARAASTQGWRSILTVFRKEFRENLRDRRTLTSALLLGPVLVPLLFVVMLSLGFETRSGKSDLPVKLAVSHAQRAPNLLAFLRQYGVTTDDSDYDDVAARLAIREHHHPIVLVIPEDFADRLAAAEPAPVALYADASDAASAQAVARVRQLIDAYSATVAHLRIQVRGVDPSVLSPIAVQDIDVSTPASRSVLALGTVSYLVLLTMLMGGMYLAIDTTAGERERGSLESLLTAPVRRNHLIYGKIAATCAYMTLSLVLTVTAFAVALPFMGLERMGMSVNFGPLVALKVVLFSLPMVPLGAALMTIVAAFTRSYREAQTWLGFVLLVPTLPLVFAGMFGLQPKLAYMAVPSLGQHFLITSLLRDEALPLPYVAISILVTLTLGAVLTLIAGRLYDREALLG